MKLIEYARTAWATMLTPPWRRSKGDVFDTAIARAQQFYSGTGDLAIHHPEMVASGVRWIAWIFLWVWFVAAVFLGAVIAPAFIQLFGLTSYRYYVSIGIALLSGVIIHLLGLLPLFLADWAAGYLHNALSFWRLLAFMPIGPLLLCWPIAAVGYALYRYLTWIGPGQRLIAVAFVWSLLLTTLGTVIKGVALPYGGKRLLDWIRGGAKKSPNAPRQGPRVQ